MMHPLLRIHPARLCALAGWLLLVSAAGPCVANAQTVTQVVDQTPQQSMVLPLPEPAPQSATNWRSYVTPKRLAEGAGALLGFVAFNFYVAPLSAVSGVGAAASLRSWLGTRVAASTLAATGAVATGYAYDRWAGNPIDYGYAWERGGAVVGVGAGSALLAVLGYPASATLPRFSAAWTANRSFLLGSALLGAWLTEKWWESTHPAQPDAANVPP
jgi:hypothetical protein